MNVAKLRALPENEDDAVRAYSVARLAELWDVGTTYVYDRINDGTLPTVELGSTKAKTRVRHPDAVAFIEQRRTA